MKLIDRFNLEQAAKVAHISTRRATYWASKGVLVPTIAYDRDRSPYVYLYDFVDVVGLRTLAILRDEHGLSLQSLRKAHHYLRQHSDRPWSQLKFWVRGKDLFFKDPATEMVVSPTKHGQATIAIELEPVAQMVRREANKLSRRNPTDIGQTQRQRGVQRNQLVLKGTRVPVQSVMNLAADGYSPEQIVKAFPVLSIEDVRAVLTDGRLANSA